MTHLPELQSLLWLIAGGMQQRQCMEAPRAAQRPDHLVDSNARRSCGQSSQPRRIAQLHEQLHQQGVDAVQQLHAVLAPHLAAQQMTGFRAVTQYSCMRHSI